MKEKLLDNLIYILIILLFMATLVELEIPFEQVFKFSRILLCIFKRGG